MARAPLVSTCTFQSARATKPTKWVWKSKLSAKESDGQLARYARGLLNGYPDARMRWLVYVTRGYDPKEPEEILAGVDNRVRFVAARWYSLYQHLERERDNLDSTTDLLELTLNFMEEHGMALSSRLDPVTVATMAHAQDAIVWMNGVLAGAVRERFREAFGGASKESSWTDQIRNHGRYVMWVQLGQLWLVGFLLR